MRHAWLVLGILVAGCGDPKSNMGDQPKEDAYQGDSARGLLPGVVARPDEQVPGIPYAWHDLTRETSEPASAAASIPFPVTREVIERGATGFETYCAVCHGRLGNGQGMIVQRGLTTPPSFHVRRLVEAPDGHFYNVITHGYGAMFGYAERVESRERWEIVAYIRALQASGQTASEAVHKTLVADGDRGDKRGGVR